MLDMPHMYCFLAACSQYLKHQLVIDMSKLFENFFPIDYTVKVAHCNCS